MKTTPGIFAGLALSMLLAVPVLAQNKVTIYTAAPQDLVDRVIPMLPRLLCEELCRWGGVGRAGVGRGRVLQVRRGCR